MYDKPKVTIDLAEYQELTKAKNTDSNLEMETLTVIINELIKPANTRLTAEIFDKLKAKKILIRVNGHAAREREVQPEDITIKAAF